MLTLERKKGEEIVIGDDIVITVKEVGSDSVKLTISAPRNIPVFRRELLEAAKENRKAASGSEKDADSLAALLTSDR
ncbi:MAG TPA: carbon storage regulator [Candidatus Mediterraneibacter norfolkensis]|nr:carbon storage regulator [Candidatus Mediterraneibacter norfolkensis]